MHDDVCSENMGEECFHSYFKRDIRCYLIVFGQIVLIFDSTI